MLTFTQRKTRQSDRATHQGNVVQTGAPARGDLQEALNQSSRVQTQLRLSQTLNGGPRAIAQARLSRTLAAASASEVVAQRQTVEDEDRLMTQAKCASVAGCEEMGSDEEASGGEVGMSVQGGSQTLQGRFDGGAAIGGGGGRGPGLPAGLRAGVETLSGVSLSDVSVEYDSPEPARIGALATTQGRSIRLGPGQERHLAHEAWHTAQQKQGRVRATTQLSGVAVNDDSSLEREADVMGARAAHMTGAVQSLAGQEESAPPEATGKRPSTKASSSPGEAPVQGVFLYFWNGQLYLFNPNPYLNWVQLPGIYPYAPPQDQPAYVLVPSGSAPITYGYPSPVRGSASSNLAPPLTGPSYASSSLASVPQIGGVVSTPVKTTRAPLKPTLPEPEPKSSAHLGFMQGLRGMIPVKSIRAPETSRIIFQAGYMSGDRYGMAAALNLYDDLGVLVLANEVGDSKAEELLRFYKGAVPAYKIGDCYCGSSQILYRMLNDEYESRVEFQKLGHFNAELLPLGTGTRLVAEAFTENEEGSREKIKKGWFGSKENIREQNVLIRKWLEQTIGMPPGKYALLWVKTGEPLDEKSYHYTDPDAWAQLLGQIRKKTGRKPVLIGEPLPGVKDTKPSLVKFWERDYPGKSRLDQQRLFNFFATSRDYDVVNVGMKSGATEGPALMGLPTIYLEEAGNIQAGRMEQWLQAMPNFMRVILDAPPGDMQKESLAKIYSGSFLRQAEGRLRPEMGDLSERFPEFMEKKKSALLSKTGEKGLNPSELRAVLDLLKTDPEEWAGLKQAEFVRGQDPQERYAMRNLRFEESFKDTLGEELGPIRLEEAAIWKKLGGIMLDETFKGGLAEKEQVIDRLHALRAGLRRYMDIVADRFKKRAPELDAVADEQAGTLEKEIAGLRSVEGSPKLKDAIHDLAALKAKITFVWWGL